MQQHFCKFLPRGVDLWITVSRRSASLYSPNVSLIRTTHTHTHVQVTLIWTNVTCQHLVLVPAASCFRNKPLRGSVSSCSCFRLMSWFLAAGRLLVWISCRNVSWTRRSSWIYELLFGARLDRIVQNCPDCPWTLWLFGFSGCSAALITSLCGRASSAKRLKCDSVDGSEGDD